MADWRSRAAAGAWRSSVDRWRCDRVVQPRLRRRRPAQLGQGADLQVGLVPEPSRHRGVRAGVVGERGQQRQRAHHLAAVAVEPDPQSFQVGQVGSPPMVGPQRVERGEGPPQALVVGGLVHVGRRGQHGGLVSPTRQLQLQLVVAHRGRPAGQGHGPSLPVTTVDAPRAHQWAGFEVDVVDVVGPVLESQGEAGAAPVGPVTGRPHQLDQAGTLVDHGHHRGQRHQRQLVEEMAQGPHRVRQPGLGGQGRVRVDGGTERSQHGHDGLGSGLVPGPRHVPVPALDPQRRGLELQLVEGGRAGVGHGEAWSASPPSSSEMPRRGMVAQSGRWLRS